jgi:hypothetical protein
VWFGLEVFGLDCIAQQKSVWVALGGENMVELYIYFPGPAHVKRCCWEFLLWTTFDTLFISIGSRFWLILLRLDVDVE